MYDQEPDLPIGPGSECGPGGPGCGGCGGPCGPTCGGCCPTCGPACSDCWQPCCSPAIAYWVHVDYLMWWTKGMETPPLVTTGPSASQPGYIGYPGTQVLYGGDRILDRLQSGGRVQAGLWLDTCDRVGSGRRILRPRRRRGPLPQLVAGRPDPFPALLRCHPTE